MANSQNQSPVAGRKWELDQASFQALLRALDSDPTKAGAEYERLRRRMIQFFMVHGMLRPEEITDEAFNRLAKRIGEGQEIQNVEQYATGIGRMLVLEERQRARRESETLRDLRLPAAETGNEILEALEACLEEVPPASRQLLQRYYSAESRGRIVEREKMAAEMGISLNSLRNRALRLREKLQLCVEKRLGSTGARDVRSPGISTMQNEKI